MLTRRSEMKKVCEISLRPPLDEMIHAARPVPEQGHVQQWYRRRSGHTSQYTFQLTRERHNKYVDPLPLFKWTGGFL